MQRYLGKLPAKVDKRTLELRRYATIQLPPSPAVCHGYDKIKAWGVAGNDQYGNCVIATAAHEILAWKGQAKNDVNQIADTAVIELSREMGALDGYAILDRLNYWRQKGMWADMLGAFASVASDDIETMKNAIAIFGTLDIGLAMPAAWRDSSTWDSGRGRRYHRGSWGLHSVPLVGYDDEYANLVSWGEVYQITWEAVEEYSDERYALIDPSWFDPNGHTPSGYDLTTLQADLTTITG